MNTGYKVGEIMVRDVIGIGPENSLLECARKMAEKEVGCLVVKQGESVVGIITEQDLARKVLAQNINAVDTKVERIMSRRIHSVEPETDINDAVSLMGNNEIKHLPVIDKQGKLHGIITAKDVIQIEPGLVELLSFKSSLKKEEFD